MMRGSRNDGRQIFEATYVDRAKGTCKLPSYVDL